jgi:hypothetical protein
MVMAALRQRIQRLIDRILGVQAAFPTDWRALRRCELVLAACHSTLNTSGTCGVSMAEKGARACKMTFYAAWER